MQTSTKGITALELEEGVVLRAYRDVVGVWTIGPGLTAASGVVKPVAGMVITASEASRLLREALRRRYEPAVDAALEAHVTVPQQHEFDAAVSFHWNLGTIGKASWVRLWKAKASDLEIHTAMRLWRKAGGKVLPGLLARRDREAMMFLKGIYREGNLPAKPGLTFASWGLSLTDAERVEVRNGFSALGYNTGIRADAVRLAAAMQFQSDHALTVDGIIGRATLTALQRRLDVRAKSTVRTVAVTATAPAAATDLTSQIVDLPYLGPALFAVAVLWMGALAYSYRDVIAAKVRFALPRLARILRSF
jgi:lysozyme